MAKVKNEPQKKVKAAAAPPSDKYIYLLTGLAVVCYYLFSLKATGLYQHDEIGHYINMIDFWKDPSVILSNYAKPGYKIIYVLPALLGEDFLKFFNCLLAGLSCLLVFKTARLFKSRYAYLAFFFLALQPFWIQLAFRNYADSFSGFLLIAALYFHYKNKLPLAALLISFLSTIRQEFNILLALYGIWLLWNKKFLPVVLTAVFPLLYNFFGFLRTGDWLYLITETIKTSALTASEYPRQGFDHYFVMSSVIWTSVITLLLVLYFISLALERTSSFDKVKFLKEVPVSKAYRSGAFIAISFLVYFLVHCLFNLKMKTIGASTGGNLRYMAAVAPCAALLCALALDRLPYITKKMWVVIPLVIMLFLIGIFQTFDHNNVLMNEAVRKGSPFVVALLAAAVLFIVKKPVQVSYLFIGLMIIFDLTNIKPIVQSEEDKTIKRIANLPMVKDHVQQNNVYTNHILFKYNFYKENQKFTARDIDSNSVKEIKPGSILIWDSHYSYRPKLNPKHVNLDYFNRHSDKFLLQQNFISSDKRFQAVLYEVVK